MSEDKKSRAAEIAAATLVAAIEENARARKEESRKPRRKRMKLPPSLLRSLEASVDPPPDAAIEKREAPKALSKRMQNKGDRIVDAELARRGDARQQLGFAAREFILCGLPYKRPDGITFERRNGNMVLQVVGNPKLGGLPYGQDRLVPLWLATAFHAAGCPANNTIRFRCASDILRAFDIGTGGLEMITLRQRIERIFGATYFVYDEGKGKDAFSAEGYRLIRRADLWFKRKESRNQHSLWNNVIELDAQFAADLRQSSVPVDFETVRALKENPAALDLYLWQAWRSYRLMRWGRREVEVPLHGPSGLIAQLGTAAKRPRKAKELFRKAQALIRAAWRECPNEIIGDSFMVRPAAAIRPGARLELEGISAAPPEPIGTDLNSDRMILEPPPIPPVDNPADNN